MAQNDVNQRYDLVVIGGSAGSLGIIINILQGLLQCSFAIIIVLHRKGNADSILTGLLSSRTNLTVKEAEEKEPIVAGVVYLAPGDYHLLIENDRTISLDASEKVNFSRPSIDVTFESAAAVYHNRVAGVLLSGGNNDGGNGLRAICKSGGLTIVQDPDTADVSYMPGYALSLFKPHKVLAKDDIPGFLSHL
jgi:two-component system, chemotaxis family, protein-glutamate methylesterase/glutaminase